MAYTTIDKPSKYFNTVLFTGTGTTNAITGVGFKPDWVWLKARSNSYGHAVYDNVRGATKYLYPNLTNAEATNSTTLQSFDTDGFTIGANENTNQASGITAVSWNWLGSNTTVSNTNGSITSTVSANTTSGFSICTYTGNSGNPSNFGHGLGVAPSMVLIKNRDYSGDPTGFVVYHKSLGTNYTLNLHLTNAKSSNSISFGNTAPSSSVVYVGDDGGNWGTNLNSHTYVAYCFAEVKGFSKAFSYTGNGSTDGAFTYCGFSPAFLLIKRTDTTAEWEIFDNKRDTYNARIGLLEANNSAAEAVSSTVAIDFLSNGFKQRNTRIPTNVSGGTYIGIAFADNPFVSSKGIPTTAR
jgi:hypothetical protein